MVINNRGLQIPIPKYGLENRYERILAFSQYKSNCTQKVRQTFQAGSADHPDSHHFPADNSHTGLFKYTISSPRSYGIA